MGVGLRWSELLRDYADGLASTPQLLRRVAFRQRTLQEEQQQALLRGSLHKAFSGLGLFLMGIGFVIGNGAYGSNGSKSATLAGCAPGQHAG